jgi:hypothetical protein
MKNIDPSSTFSALQTHGNCTETNLGYRDGALGPPIEILVVIAMSCPLYVAAHCRGLRSQQLSRLCFMFELIHLCYNVLNRYLCCVMM